jgi:uncharacterized protein with GYD domain
MAKYLVHGSYTAEGLQGLMKDTASGRKTALRNAMKSIGGKLETIYYAFGADDVVVIVDAPDNTTAAAISMTTQATGLVKLRVTPLLTVEEVDAALEMTPKYRGPGVGKK